MAEKRVLGIGANLFRIMDSEGVDGLYKKYVVVAGDTLGKIAAENKTTVELLAKVNEIENVNLIEVDQELLVPVEEKKTEEVKEKVDLVNKRMIGIGANLFRVMEAGKYDGLYKKYVVVKGDTLGKIAAEFNTTVAEIAEVNDIENVDLIEIDQELFIPVEEKK